MRYLLIRAGVYLHTYNKSAVKNYLLPRFTRVYSLHPVGPVLAGLLFYPIAKAKEVFRFYQEYVLESPDALRADIGVLTALDGNLVVGIIPCYVSGLSPRANASLRRCVAWDRLRTWSTQ